MDKAIRLYELKELYKVNPNISAEELIKLAEQYVEICANVAINSFIANSGETARIYYTGTCEAGNGKSNTME